MIKTITNITSLLLAVIFINSCSQSEDLYSTELRFPEFENVTVKNALEVEINYGKEQKVTVVGKEEDVKNILSEVKSKALIIDINSTKKSSLKYIITIPKIKEIINETNASLTAKDFIQDGILHIVSLKNGNISLANFTNLEILHVDIEGTSTVEALTDMNVTDLNINLKDDANYTAFQIKSENAIVEINGKGSCSLSVSKLLTAKINGDGTIYYKGNPEIYSNTEDDAQIIHVE